MKNKYIKNRQAIVLIFLLFISNITTIAIGEIPGEPITVSGTYYSSTNDGFIYGFGTSYETVRDAEDGIVDSSGNILLGQQCSVGSLYYVHRSYFFIDTSAIPDNAVIVSASLSIYGIDSADSSLSIIIQNGQPTYPHEPLIQSDYDKTHYSSNGGSFPMSSFTTSGYNNIQLNSNGISWINKQGKTKLCLRISSDINGNPPLLYSDHLLSFYGTEDGSSLKPKLTIEYTLPRTIHFYMLPPDAGSITFDGDEFFNDESVTKHDGVYTITANPASGYHFSYWMTFGDISVTFITEQTTTAVISGSGSLTACFSSSNNPPYTPNNPSPSDGATGVSVSTDLSWSGGDPDGDSVVYDVYFEPEVSTPDDLVSDDQSGTTYSPEESLSYSTTYYWKIIAKDDQGATTNGPIWSFTTENQPTNPKLSFTPAELLFGEHAPGWTGSLTFEIWNSGTGTLTYSFSLSEELSGIASISPSSGSSTGEHDTIEVFVENTDWQGYSDGFIYITSNGGNGQIFVNVTIVSIPNKPYIIEGDTSLEIGESGDFTAIVNDPYNPFVRFSFDWGNGEVSDWTDYSHVVTVSYSWDTIGTYPVKVKVKTQWDVESEWSDPITVEITGPVDFYFLHITDLHLTGLNDKKVWGRTLEQINDLNPLPAFVVVTGDLLDMGDSISYSCVKTPFLLEWGKPYLDGNRITSSSGGWFIMPYNIPIYFCPGNHDSYNIPWHPASFNNYETEIADSYYHKSLSIENHNIEIFSLNTGMDVIWPDPEKKPQGDGLKNEYGNEVTLFPDDVQASTADIKIVLAHHPFVDGCSLDDEDSMVFINERPLFNTTCLNNDVDLILSGHTHSGGIRDITGVYLGDSDDEFIFDQTSYPINLITNNLCESVEDHKPGYYRKIGVFPNGDIKLYGQDEFDVEIVDDESTCFLEGTKITLADGSMKNIEDIAVGDLIKSFNFEKKKDIVGIVLKTIQHEPKDMSDYYLVINNKLHITPNHKLFMNGEWIKADDIKIGEVLGTSNIMVHSINRIYVKVSTYDLIVQSLEGFIQMMQQGVTLQKSLPYYADGYLSYKDSALQYEEYYLR